MTSDQHGKNNTSEEYKRLLDINRLKKEIPNLRDLKVVLKKDPVKGVGLFAKKNIKKNEVIAYYKIQVFNYKTYKSPTNNVYTFNIYRKNGSEIKNLIGDITVDSFPSPVKNISYWAPFANEPSLEKDEVSNAEVDLDLENNYKNRKTVKVGDTMVYKLVATKDINRGDEIMWYYGEDYIRDYAVSKK